LKRFETFESVKLSVSDWNAPNPSAIAGRTRKANA